MSTHYAQLLKDGSIYNKNGIYFKYYAPEQFEKYKSVANILGTILIQPTTVSNNDNAVIVQTENNIYQFKINPLNAKISKGKCFGYIYLGDKDFVRIVKPKKNPTIFFILGFLLITLITGGIIFINELKPEPIIEETPIIIQDISQEKTEIPVYMFFNLTKKHSEIHLSNPKNNTVDFVYELYYEDKLIYTSDKINPGNYSIVKMNDYLSVGESNVLFKIRCFKEDIEVNGSSENVIITISE